MPYRITGWLRLEGISGGHLAQPFCSSRATYSRLTRTMPKWYLSVSKDGDLGAYDPLISEVASFCWSWSAC